MFFSISVLSLCDKNKERERDICIGIIYPSPQTNEFLLWILYFYREYFWDVDIQSLYHSWPNSVAYAFLFYFSWKIGKYNTQGCKLHRKHWLQEDVNWTWQ